MLATRRLLFFLLAVAKNCGKNILSFDKKVIDL